MSVGLSVADILNDHVRLEVESIDRVYLNAYVPGLAYERGVVAFFKEHRGHLFASSALMEPMTKDFVAWIHDFVQREGIPLISFSRWAAQRRHRPMASGPLRAGRGVVFVGRAQEKTGVFAHPKAAQPRDRQDVCVDCARHRDGQSLYFYCVDTDFAPVLSQVLLLLSLQRQAVPQRSPLGPTASRQGRHRPYHVGQRFCGL
jgi:hypothetical protein